MQSNIHLLELEKKYKYKEVCDLLNITKLTGNSRVYQLKELSLYCNFEKQGHSIIFKEIYREPIGNKVTRGKSEGSKGNRLKFNNILTHRECSGYFDGYYVYRHIMNNEVVYIGKGCKRRVIDPSGRKYNINITTKEIIRRFEEEKDALIFERQLIQYYQSIGQCIYNDTLYHEGLTRGYLIKLGTKEDRFNNKVNNQINNMFKYMI